MSKFKIGDLVILKSGSPTMTVTSIVKSFDGARETGYVKVSWFQDGVVDRSEFHQDALEPETED